MLMTDTGSPLAIARLQDIFDLQKATYEANMLGEPVRKGLLLTIQERAWSPPIWVRR